MNLRFFSLRSYFLTVMNNRFPHDFLLQNIWIYFSSAFTSRQRQSCWNWICLVSDLNRNSLLLNITLSKMSSTQFDQYYTSLISADILSSKSNKHKILFKKRDNRLNIIKKIICERNCKRLLRLYLPALIVSGLKKGFMKRSKCLFFTKYIINIYWNNLQ